MRKVLYAAIPAGLALMVVGAGWGMLASRTIPAAYWAFFVIGALLFGFGVYMRRELVLKGGGGTAVRFGAGALASVGVALLALLLVNFISARYHHRIDTTRFQTFSLHPVTVRVLDDLPEDVALDVYAFMPGNQPLAARSITQLLELFEYHRPDLETEVIDPNRRPDLVGELGVRATDVTVVRARREGAEPRMVVVPGHEQADIAAALLEASRRERRVVYWVQGHGERLVDKEGGLGYRRFRQDLVQEFFDLRPLSLGAGESVPADASLLIFADPDRPIPPAETRIYQEWLRSGGRALLLSDVDFSQAEGEADPVESISAPWGLAPAVGVVMDPRARTGDPNPRRAVGDAFPEHEAVAALRGMRAVFPVARPVDFEVVPGDQQIFHQVLVSVALSSQGGDTEPYVESDLERARTDTSLNVRAQSAWTGRSERVVVAAFRRFEAAPGMDTAGREARVVLTGDADFLSDAEYDTEANAELALNLVRWLAGEELLIRQEGEETFARNAMSLEPAQLGVVQALWLIFPLAVFLSGWVIWFVRRSK